MITKEYFEKHFKQQLASVSQSGPYSVIVHLHGGGQILVHSVEAYHDGYILIDAYPESKLDEKYEKRDRHAIPYDSIASVQITLSKQKEIGPMGIFHE